MSEYDLKQTGVAVGLLDDIIATTLENRVNRVYEQMARDMNISMFGDVLEVKYTRWQLWSRRFRLYRQRIADAWLVLTGKADIGYD